MREQILRVLEKNSRIGVDELAIRIGAAEIDVANEIKGIDREIADTKAKLKKSFDELGIKSPF